MFYLVLLFYVLVFFSRCLASAEVALGFVFIEDAFYLKVQRTVLLFQLFGYVLMYRGFADAELPGRTPDCCLILNDVQGQLTGPLLNVSFQRQHAPFCVTDTLICAQTERYVKDMRIRAAYHR